MCDFEVDDYWRCAPPDGGIVDPTAEQFASSITKPRYEEVDPEAASTKDRIPPADRKEGFPFTMPSPFTRPK